VAANELTALVYARREPDDEKGAEGEDNPELDAETFGDAADGEDFVWDHVAQMSEALKSGHNRGPSSQPDSYGPQRTVAPGSKRQWLPHGEDTPTEYITESLWRLAEEQRRIIEADLAQGGPGEAPDLAELFEREYPEAVAPEVGFATGAPTPSNTRLVRQSSQMNKLDFDVPDNWSPYPLEAAFGGPLTTGVLQVVTCYVLLNRDLVITAY